MHPSTFDDVQPSQAQINRMSTVRDRFTNFAKELELLLPEGPDKTYLMRKLREIGMWANVTITRLPDGSPRAE